MLFILGYIYPRRTEGSDPIMGNTGSSLTKPHSETQEVPLRNQRAPLSVLVDELCSVYADYYWDRIPAAEFSRRSVELIYFLVSRSTILNQAHIPSDDLEDIQQACRIALGQQLERKLASPLTLKGYLRTTLQRAVWIYRRKQRVAGDREVPLEEVDETEFLETGDARHTMIGGASLAEAVTLERLRSCLRSLSPRESLLITWVFFEERPARELAKMWNVSDARVNQIKNESLNKLRKCMETGRNGRPAREGKQ